MATAYQAPGDANHAAQQRAERVIPGGVASINRNIGPPLVVSHAAGAEVVDVAGRRFIDYNCAFGATLLGHAHPVLNARTAAVSETLDLVGVGGTEIEVELAEMLVERIPCADQIAFCNSGSEATYHALRLARAATGRPKIVKFQGCYHGWHDYVSMNVMSPADRIGSYDPLSAGMLASAAAETLVLPFNDVERLDALLTDRGGEIAAVILEPIQHNIGAVVASDAFLAALRRLCTREGIVLIFDEVITGFRHAIGGYQAISGVTPDLSTFGKAVANGYPIAIIAGQERLMRHLAPRPVGDVFMAGTYNGHPATCAAAIATIELLDSGELYRHIYDLGDYMRAGLAEIVTRLGLPVQVGGYGSVWVPYFFTGPYVRYEDMLGNDAARDTAFRLEMFARGFLTSSVPTKRWNFTTAHQREHADRTLAAAEDCFRKVFS